MENLQACFGDSPTVNELLTPDPRIQGGACRTLVVGKNFTTAEERVKISCKMGRR